MSSRAITRVARTWNRRADLHNDFYSHYPSEHREQWRGVYRQALRSLLGADHGAPRVLDVGAGTGFGAVLLAELGHQVTGIGLSAKMLEHARRVAEQRGVEVDFRLHGAHDVQALERQFDLVTSRYVLWTLPEPERAVASWREVLRPGGAVRIASSCNGRRRPSGLAGPVVGEPQGRSGGAAGREEYLGEVLTDAAHVLEAGVA